MYNPGLLKHKGSLGSTGHLRRFRFNNFEQYLRLVEPNQTTLYTDLRYLARYMVKCGYNVKLARIWLKKGAQPKSDPDIDLQRIVTLTSKYELTWKKDCHRSEVDVESNKSLYHVAAAFPKLFIDVAAGLSPGTFDQRRFWQCANNANFWLNYLDKYTSQAKDSGIKPASITHGYLSTILLSQILYILLTPKEPKLMTLNALTITLSNKDVIVCECTIFKNLEWISKNVEVNMWRSKDEYFKEHLRAKYNIMKAEQDLEHINVELFVQLWN